MRIFIITISLPIQVWSTTFIYPQSTASRQYTTTNHIYREQTMQKEWADIYTGCVIVMDAGIDSSPPTTTEDKRFGEINAWMDVFNFYIF